MKTHGDVQQQARVQRAYDTIRYRADDSLQRRLGYVAGLRIGFVLGLLAGVAVGAVGLFLWRLGAGA